MSKMKRILSMILLLTLLFSFSAVLADGNDGEEAIQAGADYATEYYSDDIFNPLAEEANAAGATGMPEVNAKSAVLMEKSSGKILYEKEAHEKLAPASITKIMTLLLVMEAIEAGKFSLEDEVTVSEHAQSMGGSQIWLQVGEVMSVADLIKATAVASANDACVALAEQVAGSEESFVAQMNQKAAELEMNDTHFANCTGLDAENHLTSANDVAIMSRELIGHQLIKDYSSIWMDSLRNGETSLVNTNKLVRFYDGCTGLKTGTTSEAGHCLSATADREGMELISVVLGSDSSDDRFNGARKLLDYGFANWSNVEIDVKSGLSDLKVTKGAASSVQISASPLDSVLVPKGREQDIVKTINLPESIAAPVEQAQVVGSISFTIDGELIAETQIYAIDAVAKMNMWVAFKQLLGTIFTV